jgi:hypothetical protein
MLRKKFREYPWDSGTSNDRELIAFMVFGHNTNLKLGSVTLHIQTEDRGEPHRLIDTMVYFHGRVLHRRTTPYADLLPLNEEREQALGVRVDEQHRTIIEEIRSGALKLEIPAEVRMPPQAQPATTPVEPPKLVLELSNAKSWLSGKQAKLQVMVKDQSGEAVPGVTVKVEFEGSDGGEVFAGQTDSQGLATIEFELPKISGADPAMVISAANGAAQGQLRFSLRAKPRMVTK